MSTRIQGVIDRLESRLREGGVLGGRFRKFYVCQREALERLLEKVTDGGGEAPISGIVQMPTGSGKTLFAAAVILALNELGRLGNVTLFLAPRSALREQTINTFREALEKVGLRLMEVKQVRDLKKLCPRPSSRDDPIIAFIKGISMELYEFLLRKGRRLGKVVAVLTPQLLSIAASRDGDILSCLKPSLIICDEVHVHYIGERTRELIKALKDKAQITLGLTATPTGKSYELFGKLIYGMTSLEAALEGIIIPNIRVKAYETLIENLRVVDGRVDRGLSEWDVAVKDRAEKYAELIRKEMESIRRKLGRYPKAAVITVNTREADLLWEALRRKLNGLDVLRAHYRVNKPSDALNEFKEMSHGLLVTVRMIDIGFDDRDLEVLFIARPIQKPGTYIQVRGRILRKPRSSKNMKEKLGYAMVVDFTNTVTKYERNIKEYEARMLKEGLNLDENLLSPTPTTEEPGEAPLARAKVTVRKCGEVKTTIENLLETILSNAHFEISLNNASLAKLIIENPRHRALIQKLKETLRKGSAEVRLTNKSLGNPRTTIYYINLKRNIENNNLYIEIEVDKKRVVEGKEYSMKRYRMRVKLIKNLQRKLRKLITSNETYTINDTAIEKYLNTLANTGIIRWRKKQAKNPTPHPTNHHTIQARTPTNNHEQTHAHQATKG